MLSKLATLTFARFGIIVCVAQRQLCNARTVTVHYLLNFCLDEYEKPSRLPLDFGLIALVNTISKKNPIGTFAIHTFACITPPSAHACSRLVWLWSRDRILRLIALVFLLLLECKHDRSFNTVETQNSNLDMQITWYLID